MRRATALLACSALVVASALPAAASAPAPADPPPLDRAQLALASADSQLLFAPNAGQWDPAVRFQAQVGATVIWVTDSSVVYDFSVAADIGPVRGDAAGSEEGRAGLGARRGQVVAMRFDGSQPARAVGHGARTTYRNYFLGTDPSRWADRVPLYEEVVLEGLYDGVDLRLYSDGGMPRYDLVLAPGADLSQVRMRFDGAEDVAVGPDGTVSMQTSLGSVEQRGLLAYQVEADGSRHVVPSAFRLADDGSLGFRTEDVDRARPLVVDPLIWSTFLGGEDTDFAKEVAVRSDGSVVVAGYTYTRTFPTTPGAYDTTYNGGDTDAFISVLSADGSELLYSTYLGGARDDGAWALAVGPDGSMTIAGDTNSRNFPATPGAYDASFNGAGIASGDDGFLTRLTADGAALIFSTYLGGRAAEFTHVLTLDADGAPVVVGTTYSGDFPATAGAYDTDYNGNRDAFVARLSSDGSALTYATYLGGTETDGAYGVGIEPDGSLTVAGVTYSTDFPVTPDAYDQVNESQGDAFIVRFAVGGASLDYATFFGGVLAETVEDLALTPDGSVTIVGETNSTDLPTTAGAYDQTYNGADDAYVAQLSADGQSLDFSTYLGGGSYDVPDAVELAFDGSVIVAGQAARSAQTPFPTTPDAYDRTVDGSYDAFLTRLTGDGTSVLYSTVLGGSGSLGELPSGLALEADGTAIITGYTISNNFPTTPGAYQTSAPGGGNGYVTRLDVGASGCALSLGATSVTPDTVAPGEQVTLRTEIGNSGVGRRVARVDLGYTRTGAVPAGTVVLGQRSIPVTDGAAASTTLRVRPTAPAGSYALELRIVDTATGATCDRAPVSLTVQAGAAGAVGDLLFEQPVQTALVMITNDQG